jgi:hypothetical protein
MHIKHAIWKAGTRPALPDLDAALEQFSVIEEDLKE